MTSFIIQAQLRCAPFLATYGCDMRSDLHGTIIRMALRGKDWAAESTFMKKLFDAFQDTLSNGRILLFLARVTHVELWRWRAKATSPERIAWACLGASSGHTLPKQPSIMRNVHSFLKQYDSFTALQQALLRPSESTLPQVHDIISITSCTGGSGETRTAWLRYGWFSMDTEQLNLVSKCSTVPLVVLAIRLPTLRPRPPPILRNNPL